MYGRSIAIKNLRMTAMGLVVLPDADWNPVHMQAGRLVARANSPLQKFIR
ncbi:hypothetical protein MSKU9_0738 [Komagataeibacter diospyri]|uniref:Uncharacterized protein n=1 Tax=Komagataeibacter diospyri TaxID=1932662 RepID=A0A4P5NQ91_9PROT|nr:hypothetical protein MSKU9_0738 [Komagataeibacter diospyri]